MDSDGGLFMSATDREKALGALARLAPWRADDRDMWLKVGMALHSVSDELLPEWDGWSKQSEKYKAKECARKWKHFKGDGGIGLGTLLALAKQDGGGLPPATADRKSVM